MDKNQIKAIAADLYKALTENKTMPKLTETYPDITVEDAYSIQLELTKLKLEAGETPVGYKIGLTRNVMLKMPGFKEPDFGMIFASKMHSQEVPLSMSELISPRIEPELTFVMKEDLKGPGVTSAQVIKATEGIMASFEIVDSRLDGKGGLPNTIADNGSGAKAVLGTKLVPVENLDMKTIGLVLENNGEFADMGVSCIVMGNPAEPVAWLANKLSEYGLYLKAGDIVMSGSLTEPRYLKAGDSYTASFGSGVGNVKIKIIE